MKLTQLMKLCGNLEFIDSKELYDLLKFPVSVTYEKWCKQNIENNEKVKMGVDFFHTDTTGTYSLDFVLAQHLALMADTPVSEDFRSYVLTVEAEFANQVQDFKRIGEAVSFVTDINVLDENHKRIMDEYHNTFG